jgi:hypothetical protein
MNVNVVTHSHERAPMMDYHDSPESSKLYASQDTPTSVPLIGNHLLPLLKQAKGGLSNISQSTLQDNLQPVVHALMQLDAELLLDLERTARGPRLREG